MTYITFKKFKRNAIDGYFNLHPGKKVECIDGYLYRANKKICAARSREGKLHFAINEDGHGLERGELTSAITELLTTKDANYQDRWNKIWADKTCQPYRRTDQPTNIWLWNDEFYTLDIPTLEYIANLIGAKKGC